MSIKKSIGIIVIFAFYITAIQAQSWTDKSSVQSEADFQNIVKDFDTYWEGREQTKGNGFKPFKRWQQKWRYRIDPKNGFPAAGQKYKAFNKFLKTNKKDTRDVDTPWESIGPNDTGTGYEGRGRINSVAFHPTNDNIIYVGSAGGGLWKTINGGNSWSPQTDYIGSIGVSAILIDPVNPNIIYIGTGDGDASDTYSIGVLKSLDGGNTWNTTGLDWATNSQDLIRRMVFDIDDNSTIIAATNLGIYRTTNAGTTWTQEVSGNFYDVEVNHDSASNTLYASTSDDIYRSTNNGASWSLIETIPNSGRLAIATTPANNNYLYILSSGNSNGANGGSGFNGLYRSTDGGNTITLQSDSPNLLNGSSSGSGSGGQGWYDLAFAAHPTQANTIHVAGVIHWKSTNGGSSWELKSHWSGAPGVQTVHADKHVLEFKGNVLWEGNDGGIYSSVNGGTSWVDKTGDMVISQMYRLSVSETNEQSLAGLQDNGTLLLENSGNWDHKIGGDGMDCAIHPTQGNTMYGEYQFGNIFRSTNGGNSWNYISGNIPGQPDGAWITPMILDPTDPNVIIAGYQDIFKSTDKGSTWSALGTGVGSSTKQNLVMSPADNNYLFVGTNSEFWSTSDGGNNWSSITAPSSSIGMIAASPANVHTIYAVRSGFTDGEKIYKSTDGGLSWENISSNLPNIPCNAVAVHDDGKETVYVGMDVGVYFKNEDDTDWTLFNTDLPNVEIRDIDIKESTNEILIATYGRGLWKNDAIGSNSQCDLPKSLNVSEVVNNTATATWSVPSSAPSNGYDWILSESQAPTGLSTSTTATSVTLNNLVPGSSYYFHVRSNCSNSKSSWSTYGPFGPFAPDYTCNEKSLDTGGANGDYSDNEDITWVICGATDTDETTVTFNSLDIESNYDALYVYDGIDTNSPLFPGGVTDMSNSFPVGGFNGTTTPGPFTSTNDDKCITLRFRSDGSVTGSGWDIDITCTTLCPTQVTNTNDSGSGSLREAILTCASADNTVTFAPGLEGQTITLNNRIIIDNNVNISGASVLGNITINMVNNGPIFTVSQLGVLNLDNLILYGGNNDSGSAIRNIGTTRLINVEINPAASNPNPSALILNAGTLVIDGMTQLK